MNELARDAAAAAGFAATVPVADAVLRAEGLTKTYQEGKLRAEVLLGIDLTVRRGESVAVIGASGAGIEIAWRRGKPPRRQGLPHS